VRGAARRHAEWLPTFHAKVAAHDRLSAEDIENYGAIPPGYVRDEPGLGDWFVWSGA